MPPLRVVRRQLPRENVCVEPILRSSSQVTNPSAAVAGRAKKPAHVSAAQEESGGRKSIPQHAASDLLNRAGGEIWGPRARLQELEQRALRVPLSALKPSRLRRCVADRDSAGAAPSSQRACRRSHLRAHERVPGVQQTRLERLTAQTSLVPSSRTRCGWASARATAIAHRVRY